MHEMTKVVADEIGTVDASPRREFELKLPSGLVSVHDSTPCEAQETVAREPRETEVGVALMTTLGTTYGPAGFTGAVVVATGIGAGFATVFAGGADISGRIPTRRLLDEQRLSNKEVGML